MYKVVFINENDEKETIEAEDFEYGDNGIVRIVVSQNENDEFAKYIPTHRFILAEGAELWVSAKDNDEKEDEEEEEEEEEEETQLAEIN